jgi:hypothetical protein
MIGALAIMESGELAYVRKLADRHATDKCWTVREAQAPDNRICSRSALENPRAAQNIHSAWRRDAEAAARTYKRKK